MRTMRSCPGCGDASDDTAKFCTNCGKNFLAAAEGRDDDGMLRLGTELGAYRVLELLGEGGMGRVYVAEHVRLGRRVALKHLRAEFNKNKIAIGRFFAEARAVNRISHENIVEITDFFENVEGHNYYIMELLKGDDVGRLIIKLGVIPLVRALDIGIQVASALTAVHAARIVHRDLKPDNIFIIDRPNRPGFVKLLDFGIAKLGDGHGIQMGTTAAGTIIGTPEYMSPEQAGGQEVDHRTDVYALGIILYEMICGTLPFKAKSFGDMVVKHMTVVPKRPISYDNLPHDISEQLDELIMQLLEKDPAKRPQAMSDVERRLSAILDDLVSHAGVDLRRKKRLDAIRRSGEVPIITPPRKPNSEEEGRQPTLPASHPSDAAILGAKPAADVKPPSPSPAQGVPVAVFEEPAMTMRVRRVRRRPLALAAGAAAFVVLAIVLIFAAGSGGSSSGKATAAAITQPVPPSPPSQPPAPVAKVVPAEVKIRFRSTPSGVAVRLTGADQVLGTTPFEHRFPREDRSATFELTAPGYVAGTQDISLAEDTTVAISLSPAPAVAAIKKPPKHVVKHAGSADRGGTMDVFDE
jgi:serine/threonine protein kinase